MKIEAYKKYWFDNSEPLYTYSVAHIDKSKIDSDTFSFLTSWGLPSDTAPFLSFSLIRENKFLTPTKIYEIDVEGLENYLMFGSDGSGSPLCIDTLKQNEVVYLNRFNFFERVFINTNIFKFAVSCIRYRDFICSGKTEDGKAGRKFTDAEFENFKSDLTAIDSKCLDTDTFWEQELDSLLWRRDDNTV